MKLIEEKGLTFDDVLLVPRYNEIESRKEVFLTTKLTRKITINAPLISANMDTVTEAEMMIAMNNCGGVGIMHRFMSIEDMVKKLDDAGKVFEFNSDEHCYNTGRSPVCASVGVGEKGSRRADAIRFHCDVICIDVAHGHSLQAIQMIEEIKNWCDAPEVIAGNVATVQGVRDLINAGADAIKVGIGPGSMCTTRLVTGNGVPQFSAIMECAEEANIYNVPIIADGGIRTSGDIVKALAAGASSVMVGSLLAGTDETPGKVIIKTEPDAPLIEHHDKDGKVLGFSSSNKYKKYQGMASKDAMTGWKGDYHAAPEGEATYVECKGPVANIVNELLAGIRSGLTYQGVYDTTALRKVAKFRLISPNCLIENRPHGK